MLLYVIITAYLFIGMLFCIASRNHISYLRGFDAVIVAVETFLLWPVFVITIFIMSIYKGNL